jgi:YfiR/HmsC-like
VALVEEDQHLRFDIDTKEGARAGLRFSSRLLRLARNVR